MQALQKIQIENNSEVGAVVSSRVIAQELEKRHAHVIRDLEKILLSPNVGSVIELNSYTHSICSNVSLLINTKADALSQCIRKRKYSFSKIKLNTAEMSALVDISQR